MTAGLAAEVCASSAVVSEEISRSPPIPPVSPSSDSFDVSGINCLSEISTQPH